MYEGRLECGSERTASAVLQLPSRAQVEKELDLYVCQPQYSAWVQAALEPNSPVCFLDTSEVSLTFFSFFFKAPFMSPVACSNKVKLEYLSFTGNI